MSTKKLPAAATLGLLSSLSAHVAIFGDGHAVGGTGHCLLLAVAAAAAVGCAHMLWRLAASSGPCVADGAVLAGRLAEYLPGTPVIFGFAAGAFELVESCEHDGHSAASLALVAMVLAIVSWLMSFIGRSITRIVAAIAIAIVTLPAAHRIFAGFVSRGSAPVLGCAPARFRIYSRPPPAGSHGA